MADIDIVVIAYDETFVDTAIQSITENTDGVDFRIIKMAAAQSVAKNVNMGASMVETEWFVLFNDDWEIHDPEWLSTMLRLATTVDLDRPIGYVSALFETQGMTGKQYGYLVGNDGSVLPARNRMPDVFGHPVLINTAMFRALEGYDEQFEGSRFSDIDFILRVHQGGYAEVHSDVTFLHKYNANPNTVKVRNEVKEKNAYRFRQKLGLKKRTRLFSR